MEQGVEYGYRGPPVRTDPRLRAVSLLPPRANKSGAIWAADQMPGGFATGCLGQEKAALDTNFWGDGWPLHHKNTGARGAEEEK